MPFNTNNGKTHKTLNMANSIILCLSSFVILAAIQGILAVDYTVTNTAANTPGGARFTNEIGDQYSTQTLGEATNFIWRIFQQDTTPADRKNVEKVSLFIDDMDGIAYAINNEIHVSARYIQSYSGDLKVAITGVLYHEMTHVWQWNGNGQAPGGLIEGIADYVRLKAGYASSHWVKPGQGDRWDQGYDVTAYFLDYCDSLKTGFVAELNKKTRDAYNNNYFVELLGKTVDQLWTDYKAKYNN
ncbi:Plant basic secretory protein (BSP) family protein [Abeliophyllum distichum]|uniref:Plant basic secretory protein (BSP) family protein n=2 Tax=Abeliophyllum distichum TaxID=126358 RepID=A0ABD1NPD7_9LAMI